MINSRLVLAAGGHAKVVLFALRSVGVRVAGLLDPAPALRGKTVESVRVLGGDELLDKRKAGSFSLANGVGASGKSLRARTRLYETHAARGRRFPPIVAKSAVVAKSAKLEDGAQVLTAAVVHPGASVGRNAVVNTGAIVEHDAAVGDHAFVCPGAVICGGVAIGEGAFIGAGAVILPLVKIGAGAVVAAGTTVRKDLAPGALHAGPAARSLRRLGGAS